MHQRCGFCAVVALVLGFCLGDSARATGPEAGYPPAGGVNAPAPSEPREGVLQTRELEVGGFAVRIPTGQYQAPAGGAPAYSVQGPIVSFRGADGQWRGMGYLETYPRLLRFEGNVEQAEGNWRAQLNYSFEDGKSYRVTLSAAGDRVLMDEQSDLGPRNIYVFDAFYRWQPTSGFAANQGGEHFNFLYLPCYYDKPEVTIRPAELAGDAAHPAAVAVLSADERQQDVAGFFVREIGQWQQPQNMGIQLWQRRQLPGEPASRHFVGPETKSDSTPNPRTAELLGQSLYEGHVTIEMNLGVGSRRLAFAVAGRGEEREQAPRAFLQLMRGDE